MSNEELAIKIQAGELDYLPELWEQTRKLIRASYKRLMRRCGSSQQQFMSYSVSLDDLEQDGYFALLEAVDAYKPESGYKFNSYLRYPIMNHFFTAIGLRTAKGRNDPLSAAISLDKPIAGEDGELTLADAIADENSLTAFENILDDVHREQLHNVLEYCLSRLEPQQEKAIRAKYYNNKTLEQIADEMGCSLEWARQTINKGLRKLRHPTCTRLLKPFVMDTEEPISNRDINLYRTGLQAFRNSRVSPVERAVELLEKRKYNII